MTYGCKILHADPCPTWPGHGLGQMSLRGSSGVVCLRKFHFF